LSLRVSSAFCWTGFFCRQVLITRYKKDRQQLPSLATRGKRPFSPTLLWAGWSMSSLHPPLLLWPAGDSMLTDISAPQGDGALDGSDNKSSLCHVSSYSPKSVLTTTLGELLSWPAVSCRMC
jgi:hypothetical protein